ncbi:mitochondrial inner membrane protease ATP23 [Cryptococcus neoformans]|nr:mitochondrial inner membrane protease ATP23 [Cryptococcus neoformans]
MPENPPPSSSPTEAPEQSAAFEKWRSGLAQFTGLGLSESEKAERERLKEQGKLEKDWDRCEGWKRNLMNYTNPACTSPDMAEKAVNEVWESCFTDTRPFDEIY